MVNRWYWPIIWSAAVGLESDPPKFAEFEPFSSWVLSWPSTLRDISRVKFSICSCSQDAAAAVQLVSSLPELSTLSRPWALTLQCVPSKKGEKGVVEISRVITNDDWLEGRTDTWLVVSAQKTLYSKVATKKVFVFSVLQHPPTIMISWLEGSQKLWNVIPARNVTFPEERTWWHCSVSQYPQNNIDTKPQSSCCWWDVHHVALKIVEDRWIFASCGRLLCVGWRLHIDHLVRLRHGDIMK